MAEAYLGEIRIFPYKSVIPQGWAKCDGSILPVNQNQALFSLINNTYGGDGKTTFALPDLRGRVAVNATVPSGGGPYILGKQGGLESVALTSATVPAHSHTLAATSTTATLQTPKGNYIASIAGGSEIYAAPGTLQALAADSLSTVGAGAAHENRQPSLALIFCICTQGYYPERP